MQIKIIGIAFASAFFLFALSILLFGLHDLCPNNCKVDHSLIVVFGNTVNRDGSLSPRLKARLDKAIEVYANNPTNIIFASGGFGKEGFYEGIKMAEYLIKEGIPKENVIIDNVGNNTEATVKNSIIEFKKQNAIKKESLTNITAVSQYFHIARIMTLHKNEKENTVALYHVSPLYFELRDVYSIAREIVALLNQAFQRHCEAI